MKLFYGCQIFYCILGSPFSVVIKDKINPDKVNCYGRGLESGVLRQGQPAMFTIDTSNAGDAQLDVTVCSNGIYDFNYTVLYLCNVTFMFFIAVLLLFIICFIFVVLKKIVKYTFCCFFNFALIIHFIMEYVINVE